MGTKPGDVIGRMQVKAEHLTDDVIDTDTILAWGRQKRIITGADLLGRLLRGIATLERPAPASSGYVSAAPLSENRHAPCCASYGSDHPA
jgi:hypothetical protein